MPIARPSSVSRWAALRVLLVLTVLLGLAYPLVDHAASAQVGLPATRPTARLVDRRAARSVGSAADRPGVRRATGVVPAAARRPPATATTPLRLGGSNLGPSNARPRRPRSSERRRPRPSSDGADPADGARRRASPPRGSGLDPHISPGVRRAAGRPGRPGARPRPRPPCASSSTSTPQGRTSGFLGEPRVNVLRAQPRARRRALTRAGRLGTMGTRAGRLRVYLGAAPGVGKTYAMLERGPPPRRARAPTWSSAFVETHGRPHTAAHARRASRWCPAPRLELPRRDLRRRWTSTPCSPARPQVALVDELAHTNVPGCRQREALAGRRGAARRRHRRHHDGQHPAPRVAQRRRRADHRRPRSARPCPTRWSAAADQIELVDMTAEALRRRLAHGNVYARREDRRRAVATTSGSATSPPCASSRCCGSPTGSTTRSQRYRADHGIDRHLGGARAGRRRPHRRARGRDADAPRRPDRGARPAAASCSPCTSPAPTGSPAPTPARWPRQRRARRVARRHLPHGRRRRRRRARCSTSPAAVNATQLVLGVSRAAALARICGRAASADRGRRRVGRHRRAHRHARRRAARGWRSPPGRGRLSAAPPGARASRWRSSAARCSPLRWSGCATTSTCASDLLLFLLLTRRASPWSAAWGRRCVGAVVSASSLNCFFTPPLHTLTIAEPENALALLVFVLVAAAVASRRRPAPPAAPSRPRARRARRRPGDARRQRARRGRRGAEPSCWTGSARRSRLTRGRRCWSAADERSAGPSSRRPGTAAGATPARRRPRETASADGDLVLALRGRPLPPSDQRLLDARSPRRSAVVLERERLAGAAAEAAALAEANAARTALLAGGLPRPAHPARRRSRRRSAACAATDVDLGREDAGRAARDHRGLDRPARRASSTTCST